MNTDDYTITIGSAYVVQEGDRPEPKSPDYVMRNGVLVPKNLEPKRAPMGFVWEKG